MHSTRNRSPCITRVRPAKNMSIYTGNTRDIRDEPFVVAEPSSTSPPMVSSNKIYAASGLENIPSGGPSRTNGAVLYLPPKAWMYPSPTKSWSFTFRSCWRRSCMHIARGIESQVCFLPFFAQSKCKLLQHRIDALTTQSSRSSSTNHTAVDHVNSSIPC